MRSSFSGAMTVTLLLLDFGDEDVAFHLALTSHSIQMGIINSAIFQRGSDVEGGAGLGSPSSSAALVADQGQIQTPD